MCTWNYHESLLHHFTPTTCSSYAHLDARHADMKMDKLLQADASQMETPCTGLSKIASNLVTRLSVLRYVMCAGFGQLVISWQQCKGTTIPDRSSGQVPAKHPKQRVNM